MPKTLKEYIDLVIIGIVINCIILTLRVNIGKHTHTYTLTFVLYLFLFS